MVSKIVRDMLTLIMQETLINADLHRDTPICDGICLHIIPSSGELGLDFIIYCRFVDN